MLDIHTCDPTGRRPSVVRDVEFFRIELASLVDGSIAACSPIVPLARFAMRMRRLFIANERSSLGATWPRMSRRCGEAAICPALFKIGAIASERSDFV